MPTGATGYNDDALRMFQLLNMVLYSCHGNGYLQPDQDMAIENSMGLFEDLFQHEMV